MDDPRLVLGETRLFVDLLEGEERLGETTCFHVEVTAPEPLDAKAFVGSPAALILAGHFDARVVHGVVWRIVAIATSQKAPARRYKIELRSEIHALSLRRRSRVFQKVSVPDIVKKVLEDAGFSGDRVVVSVLADHPKRTYVTQYAETDLTFVRRLCEEDGLYFRFEAKDGFDAFVLEDTSTLAPKVECSPLPLVDASGLSGDRPSISRARLARQRRPGKVTVRDYAPANPKLDLEAAVTGGVASEQGTEVYRAPAGHQTPGEGKRLAGLLLESLRAESLALVFETTFFTAAPGLALEIAIDPGYAGSAKPEGAWFVTAVRHAWKKRSLARTIEVSAISADVPYRLARVTPRPQIHGIHSAIVTGASGEEIHTDDLGHAKIHFHWDREQAYDDKSSLPVRVLQPNMPGSQLVPRVGWEVFVAFEVGDPDRPYVLGRVWNGKWLPPHPLPANKTITALGTVSSPGGGRGNSVHFDDAAGREHIAWNAGFGKTTSVANNAKVQTAGFEKHSVKGSQSRTVGANETISVSNAYIELVDSQTISVAVKHDVLIKATSTIKVGSESVTVGGALLEQVGNPVDGLKNLADEAVLAGVEQIPGIGEVLSTGIEADRALQAIKEGYAKGGWSGAFEASGQAVSLVAGAIPGGDAIVAAADATGLPPWSDKAQARKAEQTAGGGTGGSSAAGAGAAAAAAGHRKVIVDGVMSEAIVGACASTTPGSINWTCVGAVGIGVGGGHSTKAVAISQLTGGPSSDTCASVSITTAKAIGRTVGALSTTIAGSLKSSAGGPHNIKAKGNLTFDVGGAMTVKGGSVVFQVGSNVVVAHGGGVVLKASKIVLNGKNKQSGKATTK